MDGNRMSSGFYKYESNNILYGPNFVYNEDYTLLREEAQTIDFPVDGWYWFDTMEDAYAFFNIPLPEGENE